MNHDRDHDHDHDHDQYPWYCAIEGDIDISYYPSPTEVESILNAHIILDAEYTAGQKVKFKIGKCSHPVDSVGNCGNDAFLNMLERCDEEMRSSDSASFDMNPSDINKLGDTIKNFILKNSKVNIWYCNDPEAKEYTYIVGEEQ